MQEVLQKPEGASPCSTGNMPTQWREKKTLAENFSDGEKWKLSQGLEAVHLRPQESDKVARTGKNQTALGSNLGPTACWLFYLGELLHPSEVFLKKKQEQP